MSIEEASAERALVELTATEYLVNLCRIIRDELEALRSLLQAYGDLNSEKKRTVIDIYGKVRSIKERGENQKSQIMEYLVKSSELSTSTRSYIEITRILDRIIQHLDGVGYRFALMIENGVLVGREATDDFVRFIEMLKEQLDSLEASLDKLRVSPKKALEILNRVFIIEEDIDEKFRRGLFEMYGKYAGYVSALLILKDIYEHLEEVSDFFKSAGEELRYLILVKSAMA
ncbi:MAG: DUF47 family protein [Desulfurococcaceae archaeon]|jgi:uncharacterized protein Yka (UPF0111/DUF47 family)|nr:DUF47 family protein [Desulfurococcaceae archaeon]